MKAEVSKNLLPLDATLKDVLQTLNRSPIGIIFFVDSENKLQGIMTDGDVRRTVLGDADLDEPAKQYMVCNYVYGKTANSRKENIKLLNNRIRHLPILDEQGRLADFISLPGLYKLPVMEPNLGGNELYYVVDCIKTNWISSQGLYVRDFEDNFARHHDINYALTTSNGTTALHLALTALGIGPGDEVLVPDLTFAASANSVMHCGAHPVFVDVSPDYWNINPELIEEAITPKTRAIMPVHLYGHPCDMDPILEVARKHNLFIVEDCAESLGARYKGKLVGTLGDVGCFSFFSNKIITTGEGGMVITHDPDLYDKMEVLRNHGMRKEKRYRHEVVGFNYRMTNLQAAIGLAQLEQIEKFLEKRRNIAEKYSELFQDIPGLTLPPEMPWAQNICWLYSILIDENKTGISRDSLILELQRDGIETRPFFYPLHQQPAFPDSTRSFPVAQKLAYSGLSLPTSNLLSPVEIEKVCSKLKRVIENALIMTNSIIAMKRKHE